MFDFLERSRTLGKPLDLYLFQINNDFYAYCDGEKDHVFGGRTYEAVPIKRTAVTASGGLDRATITVSLADTVTMCARLRGYPSSATMTLTLRQGHKDDPDNNFLVGWVGRVLGAQGNPDTGARDLTCQPASTSLKRIGLRRKWQYGCPHVLYGDQCRASITAATVQTTAGLVDGNAVALPAGWEGGKIRTKFVGGLAMWAGETRTIIRAEAGYVTLGGPATGLAMGDALSLALGCNHLRDDCMNVHVPRDEAPYGGGNIRNYGGQPYIPQTNPIGYVSNYV